MRELLVVLAVVLVVCAAFISGCYIENSTRQKAFDRGYCQTLQSNGWGRTDLVWVKCAEAK